MCVTDLLSHLEEAKDAGVESKPGKKSVKKPPAKTGGCVHMCFCMYTYVCEWVYSG